MVQKGEIPWNKGLTKFDHAGLAQMAINKLGHRVSEETKRKLSASHMGHVGYNKGIPMSEETKRRMSEARKLSLPPKSVQKERSEIDG